MKLHSPQNVSSKSSRGRPGAMSRGRPESTFIRRPLDILLRCPQDVSSGGPRNGQIVSSGWVRPKLYVYLVPPVEQSLEVFS